MFTDEDKSATQLPFLDNGEVPAPSTGAIRKLNEQALTKLTELTRRTSTDPHLAAEIIAAKDLIAKGTHQIQR